MDTPDGIGLAAALNRIKVAVDNGSAVVTYEDLSAVYRLAELVPELVKSLRELIPWIEFPEPDLGLREEVLAARSRASVLLARVAAH